MDMYADKIKNESLYDEMTVDKYRAIYYAGASGDFNPIHIDVDAAKALGLKSTILHGLCTEAFVVNTVSEWVGGPEKIKSITCRFASPVYIGDTIKIKGEKISEQNGTSTYSVIVSNRDDTRVLENVIIEAVT